MEIKTKVTIDLGVGHDIIELTVEEALQLADLIYKTFGTRPPAKNNPLQLPQVGTGSYPLPFASPVATYNVAHCKTAEDCENLSGERGQERVFAAKFGLPKGWVELGVK